MNKTWLVILSLGLFYLYRKGVNSSMLNTNNHTENDETTEIETEPDPVTGSSSVDVIFKHPNASGTPVISLDPMSNERKQYRKNKKWFLNDNLSHHGFYLEYYQKDGFLDNLVNTLGPSKPTVTNDKFKIIHTQDRGYIGAFTLDGILLAVDEMNVQSAAQGLDTFFTFYPAGSFYRLQEHKLRDFSNEIEEINTYNKSDLLLYIGNNPASIFIAEIAGRIIF